MVTKEFLRLPLTQIIPYENNPRINDEAVKDVIESVKQCGELDPIEVDENNVILSGHTRLKAYYKLGFDEADCVRFTGLDEEQKRKYRLLANKTGEKAQWDFSKLEEELKDLDFDGYDFGFGEFAEEPTEITEDEPPEVKTETTTKRGDVFQLGEHRLMCGDSTNTDDVAELMGGGKANLVFTDPPYNVSIGAKNRYLNTVQPSGRCCTDIEGDSCDSDEKLGKTLWLPVFKNLYDNAEDDCALYVTMPQGGTHMMMMMMIAESGWTVKHELMWLKNSPTFSLGRLDYDYQHEPILYGWKKSHRFFGKGDHKKSVWEIDKPRKSPLHPTMKPVELVANAILNSSLESEIVADFFGGSGTTLIACEQTNRKCYMMELDPHYCDVIIERWEKLTGKKAVKLK